MRTEVKVGLIAGVVVIGAAVIFLVNKGSSTGQPADHIPWNANPDQAGNNGHAVAARDARRAPNRPQGTHTGRIPEKSELTRRTPPPLTAQPAERPSATGQPAPLVSGQRRTLPPVVTSQRTVVTPPPEPRIPAGREVEPREAAAPPEAEAAPPAPRETTTAEPAGSAAAAESHALEAETAQPLRVGPLPRTTPTSGTRPESVGTPPVTPGVAVPPRPAETMRVDEPAARIRDASKPRPEPTRYTVEESDTLTYIARQKYGDGKYWTKIRDANPGINPDRLLVGQVLIIPSKEEVTGMTAKAGIASGSKPGPAESAGAKVDAAAERPTKTYVVASGDSLISIARNVLGDGSRWRQIYALNKDKIKNPDILLEGTELKLPENGAKAGAGGAKTAPNGAKKPALRKTRP
jgi:nucleoid-associated protein YgaU